MAVSTQLKVWSLEELHSLPDDGNKYELIYGELFVTPAPTLRHEPDRGRGAVRPPGSGERYAGELEPRGHG